ncbi:MAG TPA: hypothetical protein VFJ58_22570 [Armatimonadota bacterium]|nr:hypothetical protein [Armatimonadota bacterium]
MGGLGPSKERWNQKLYLTAAASSTCSRHIRSRRVRTSEMEQFQVDNDGLDRV